MHSLLEAVYTRVLVLNSPVCVCVCVISVYSGIAADESSGKLEPKITYRFPREEEHFVSDVTLCDVT